MNTTHRTLSSLLILGSLSSLVACGPGLQALHRRAEAGQVQSDAPLSAVMAVEIAAPSSVVWQRLTTVDAWAGWMPHVTETQAPQTLAAGETFTWTKNGSTIHSTLARVIVGSELAWSGSVATAKAIHVWRLSEPRPGVTRLEVEETMDGFLLTAFFSQADLEKDMAESVAALKTAAESAVTAAR